MTQDNVLKRGNVIVYRCLMCKKDWKSIDHWLLHYEFARDLWDVVHGFSWDMPKLVVGFLHATCLGGG